MDEATVDRALALAMRDRDTSIGSLALTILARRGDRDTVIDLLRRALSDRSERVRAGAAQAARGLAERDARAAVELLEPLLGDPSHDVRAALLSPLAVAYAGTRSPLALEISLRAAEARATERLVVAAAFAVLAAGPLRDQAVRSLESVVATGPALARQTAKLTLGLIVGQADALAFLALLVP